MGGSPNLRIICLGIFFSSYRSECHIVIKLNNLCDYTSHICCFHPRLTFQTAGTHFLFPDFFLFVLIFGSQSTSPGETRQIDNFQ